MSWVVHNGYMSKRIVETEDMLKLKQFIKEHDIKCDVVVEQCDYYFWLTEKEKMERSNMANGYTLFGNNPELPIADNKNVCIKIKILEKEKSTLSRASLDLTTNHVGNSLAPWSRYAINEKVSYKQGVYKRKGFDAAYNQMKLSHPNVTEKSFAAGSGIKNWNNDLVKIKLFKGTDNCLEIITKQSCVETDKYNVTLTLLSIDIEKNIFFIKGWLLSSK